MANPREMLRKCADIPWGTEQREEQKTSAIHTESAKTDRSLKFDANPRDTKPVYGLRSGHAIYTQLMKNHDRMHQRYLG